MTETDKRPLKVLMLSKDLSAEGGVVDLVSTFMTHFSPETCCDYLAVGQGNTNNSKLKSLFFPLVDNFRLARHIRKKSYDCVHINCSLNFKSVLRDGMFFITLSLLRYENIVFYIHGWDGTVMERIKNNRVLRYLFKKTFSSSKLILVLASRFKSDLESIGFDGGKIYSTTTLFNGDLFKGLSRKENVSGQRQLLFLSRFVKEKGIYELLGAYKLIAQKFPDTRLVMAGDGEERERLESWVRENGLSDRVEFAGFLRGKDKARVLLDSDFFIFPTYYGEGCPISLLEAMAAGLAVVTHGAGGIPDIFVDGENGILLDSVSERTVQSAMERLLSDKELAAKIRLHNRQQAWKLYEAGVMTREMEGYYKIASAPSS